ncbi:MAG: hypothetical protein ACK5WN_20945, partial [Alphaproteobacteria bacterium]
TLILPWHMQQDGVSLATLIGLGAEDAEASSAFWQALQFGRFWFWPVVVALALALPGALPFGSASTRGRVLIVAGSCGLFAIIAQGIAIGIQGWTYPFLEAAFGELQDRQFGMGLGGALGFIGFLVLLTDGLALRGYFKGDRCLGHADPAMAYAAGWRQPCDTDGAWRAGCGSRIGPMAGA